MPQVAPKITLPRPGVKARWAESAESGSLGRGNQRGSNLPTDGVVSTASEIAWRDRGARPSIFGRGGCGAHGRFRCSGLKFFPVQCGIDVRLTEQRLDGALCVSTEPRPRISKSARGHACRHWMRDPVY